MLVRAGMKVKSRVRLARLSSLVLAAVIIFLLNWSPTVEVPLDISRFGHDSGFAYIGPAPTFGGGAYRFETDGGGNEEHSDLTLLENGQALDTRHTPHDIIRTRGGGGYSHSHDPNGDYILFSASDNTNPLSNGRRYTASATAVLLPVWHLFGTAALLAILLGNLFIQFSSTGFLTEGKIENRQSATAYRADIDGLRAVAVTLVILFHLGISWMPGGYVGVDVFFVISGYLITGIISSQVEAGRFSFVGFYQRRIKRIFPALFVTVAATLAAGVFLLLPGDYATAAKSAIYAVSASSNFYFLFNTGYFDAAAEMMPLLHTWSLGVEEQFYLVWPALIVWLAVALGRDGRQTVLALSSVAILSYIYGVILLTTDPKAAFYLPLTRGWEFVAGALMSQAAIGRFQINPILAKVSGPLGLALIVGSAVVITDATQFPSWMAMLPVVGAALIVAPFNTPCIARIFLRSWPVVFTGRISYSLYLWHWPIITLYRHYNLSQPLNGVEAFWLAALTCVVSFLSWRYVEEPFRRAPWPAWMSIGMGFATAAALAATAFVIVSYSGFPQRIPPNARLYESMQDMWQWQCPQKKEVAEFGARRTLCVLGASLETAKTHGILIGDSHAEHFSPLLDVAARAAGVALLEPALICMPLVGTTSIKRYVSNRPTYSKFCAGEFAPIMAYIREHDDIRVIVIAAAWSGYPSELYRHDDDKRSFELGLKLTREGIKEIAANLGRGDRQILIISDVPRRQDFGVGCLARSALIHRLPCPDTMFMTPTNSRVMEGQSATNAMIRALPSAISNVSVSIPHDYLCDRDGCTTVLNNEFLYRDNGHLRKNMTPETKTELTNLLHLRESIEEVARKSSSMLK